MKNLELNQMEIISGQALDCSDEGKLAFIAGSAVFGGIAALGWGAFFGAYAGAIAITIYCDEQNN